MDLNDHTAIMNMKLKTGLATAGVFAAGFLSAAWLFYQPPEQQGPPPEDQVIARFGDQWITIEEFREEMGRRGGHQPGQFHSLEQKRALLDAMIEDRRQRAAARAAGFHLDPEVLRIYERAAVSRFHEARLNAELARQHVTDEEVRAWYDEHQADYAIPPRYRAALILLPAPADGSESGWSRLREQAGSVLDQVRELPADVTHFGSLAQAHSAHRASRYNGGAVAWLVDHPGRRNPWSPEVVEAVFALEQPGELAPPVETDDGIFLLRLMEKQVAQPRPFDKVADGIRYDLERNRRKAVREEVLGSLVDLSDLQVYEARLSDIEPINPRTADRNAGPPALPKS